MLEKYPMAAAPKAWTTRKVSPMAFSPMKGSTQHAGERGEGRADGPRDAPHPDRVDGLHGHQFGIIDDGPHGEPGAREAEQRVQEGHADNSDDRYPQLRVEHVDAAEPEALDRTSAGTA